MDMDKAIRITYFVEAIIIVMAFIAVISNRLDIAIFLVCGALLTSHYLNILFFQLGLDLAQMMAKQAILVYMVARASGVIPTDTVKQRFSEE